MRFAIPILLLALAASSPGHAQQSNSAESMLPHCIAGRGAGAQDTTGARCLGIISTLSFVSRVLPDELKFCHPADTPPKQMIEAVAAFLQANPDAGRQDFRLVALAAMRGHWPCEDQN
jgi:hypothetical protein